MKNYRWTVGLGMGLTQLWLAVASSQAQGPAVPIIHDHAGHSQRNRL